MKKKVIVNDSTKKAPPISKQAYKDRLHQLQIELVKLQRQIIKCDERILVIFEGRDASGKDGTIKRIVQHLSPRETRIVALGKPSDRDQSSWYFQRYVAQLPMIQECVLFNRSWYNRAGVERVMGFCTKAQYEDFMGSVSEFEGMLVRSGVTLIKYYLDISKSEQQRRLNARKADPLKQWKISPIDEQAVKHWKAYSRARNEMLERSHSALTPWTVVRANDKHLARLNVIRDLLRRVHYTKKDLRLIRPDSRIVFAYDPAKTKSNHLSK